MRSEPSTLAMRALLAVHFVIFLDAAISWLAHGGKVPETSMARLFALAGLVGVIAYLVALIGLLMGKAWCSVVNVGFVAVVLCPFWAVTGFGLALKIIEAVIGMIVVNWCIAMSEANADAPDSGDAAARRSE